MIKSRKIDHIGLAVPNVEIDAKWYQDILGFSILGKFRGNNGSSVYFLSNGESIYEMYQEENMDPKTVGKIDHISLVSTDIEADYRFCVSQNYIISTDGIENIPNFWDHGIRYFKIVSPTGEQIEFCQKL
jgi:lactoylglutathione lyase